MSLFKANQPSTRVIARVKSTFIVSFCTCPKTHCIQPTLLAPLLVGFNANMQGERDSRIFSAGQGK